jgi:hypothetical protein
MSMHMMPCPSFSSCISRGVTHTSEDKVCIKDPSWFVGMVYDPTGQGVCTTGPGVDGVLHLMK